MTHRSLIFDYLPLGSGPISTFPTFIATDAAGELHYVEGSATLSGPIETDVSACVVCRRRSSSSRSDRAS